jgi:hypothetical protein
VALLLAALCLPLIPEAASAASTDAQAVPGAAAGSRSDATSGQVSARRRADAEGSTSAVTVCFALAGMTAERQVVVPAAAVALLLQRTRSYLGPCAAYGPADVLGDGTARTYVQSSAGAPRAVGIVLSDAALDGLPTEATDGLRCYDVNGDDAVDEMEECAGGHAHELAFGTGSRATAEPYRWALLNWNPHGHGAPGVYTYSHFDFHFYLQSLEERNAIRPGPCGIVVHCEDHARGVVPVPADNLPVGYQDIGAVEVAMGNHLVDQSGPEWHGEPFMKAMIFGSYDGKISFIEPMVAREFLVRLRSGAQTSGCYPVPQPRQWQAPGWYPAEYCLRHRANRGELTVSLERFTRIG